MRFATVHIVVPAEDAADLVEKIRDGDQAVFFTGTTPGVSTDALAAGADPESWPTD